MFKQYYKVIIFTILLVSQLVFFIDYVYSQSAVTEDLRYKIGAQDIAFRDKVGFEPGASIGSIIAAIIKGFLALLGVIFVILILIGGYNWMTAAGDEEKVRKAKDTIQRAIIGFLIIAAAYAITYFVFKYMPWGGGGGGTGMGTM